MAEPFTDVHRTDSPAARQRRQRRSSPVFFHFIVTCYTGSSFRRTLAGTPTATTRSGKSATTVAPAPTVVQAPTQVPGSATLPIPDEHALRQGDCSAQVASRGHVKGVPD